ncbi:MAG: arginase family protein [Gemmatimonadota bacterium]|jgi:arginase
MKVDGVRILSVAWDSGHRGRRMGAGPLRLLDAGVLDRLRRAGHDVDHVPVEPETSFPAEVATTFELARGLSRRVREAVDAGLRPLVLSGGCGSAAGTVAGLGADDVGVVWFDAHGDLNTPETTTSGFVDGTAAAALLGRCWTALTASIPGFAPVDPRRVAFVGLRDLDPAEEAWLGAADAARPSVRTLGATLERMVAAGARRLYVHVDVDVLDPAVARVNPYQAPDGLALEELLGAIHSIGARLGVAAGAVASFDPAVDRDGRGTEAALRVVEALAGAG